MYESRNAARRRRRLSETFIMPVRSIRRFGSRDQVIRVAREPHRSARRWQASSRAFARAFALAVSVLLAFAPPASAGGWDSGGRAAEAEAEVPANAPACVSCEVIARELETALYALEGHDVDVAGLTEEHARKAAQRRSLMHGRSELRIDETLGGFCDAFVGDRRVDGSDRDADVLPGHCASLVDAHGETVGDHVFAAGPRHMRDLLCVRLSQSVPRARGHPSATEKASCETRGGKSSTKVLTVDNR